MSPRVPAIPFRLSLVAALLVGIALRFEGLARESLWFDEGHTVRMIAGAPGDVVRTCAADVHPPLYFLLLWAWTQAVGASDAALRALSAVFGSLAVAATAGLARRLVGPRAALVATWIAALSPLLLRYSQDARPYALLVLVATASSWAFVEYARAPSRARWIVWVVPTALLLWIHVIGITVLLAQAVCALFVRGRAGRSRYAPLWPVLAGLLCVGLAFLPWVPNLLASRDRWAGYGVNPAKEAWHAAIAVVGTRSGLAVLVFCAGFGGFAWARLRPAWARRPGLVVAGLLTIVPFGIPLALSVFGRSTFVPRLAIAAVPPFVALLGAGLVAGLRAMRRGRARRELPVLAVVVALVVVPGLLRSIRRTDNEDWRGAAATIAAEAASGDVVLAVNEIEVLLLRRYLPAGPPLVEVLLLDPVVGAAIPPPQPGRQLWHASSVHSWEVDAWDRVLATLGWRADVLRSFHGVRIRLFRP